MRTDISGWKTRLNEAMLARFTASGQWSGKTLSSSAAYWATHAPANCAVVDDLTSLTFAELYEKGVRLAAALRSYGVVPGDVISFQLPNWHETSVINVAASLGGFVCNPIVPIYRDAEVGYILKHSRTRVFFIPGHFRSMDYLAMVERLRPSLPKLQTVVVLREKGVAGHVAYDDLFASQQDADPIMLAASFPPVDPNAIKLLLFTSGTTGDPKGVLHSHNTIAAEVEAAPKFWGLACSDVVLMPSPVTHITGYLYALEMSLSVGMKVVLMERWLASDAIDLIDRHKCSFTIAATPFLVELCAEAERRGTLLSTLRCFASGGAPVPPEVVRRASTVLPGCLIFRVYGSSEAPTVSLGVRQGDTSDLGATTDGAIANHEARIINQVTGEFAAFGEEGEIVTRGPELMLGYTKTEYTEESFDSQGFFHTGDLGFITSEGYITVTGRKKDLIIRGGENISPKEVEDFLHEHPSVQEAAVVAMPHARLGEAPCAYVVLRQGASFDMDAMVLFLEQARLARQKFPERLFLVESLPRTASGKVLKHVLRERVRRSVEEGK